MLTPQEVLRRKRDGRALAAADIAGFVAAMADGRLCDAQVGAFAMAVRLQCMDAGETLALTLAMRDSGLVLDWSDLHLDGPVVDKHSTGGVGDVVSLMLGPMLAACGAYVPMISGRGLGHTGGTLDKLEAIPGYTASVSADRLQHVTRTAGVAIVGAGAELAPADRRLYAIRDLTETVDSIPLITASILAKKLAECPAALVLDVKTGTGATMSDPPSAHALAHGLVDTAASCGVAASALITDMNEPLAPAIGDALELLVALRYLRGDERPVRLHAVTLALGVELLCTCGLAAHAAEAERRLLDALDSGRAAERFARMVALLGGPPDVIERHAALIARAPLVRPVMPERTGYVAAMDARALGLCVVALGGGRGHPDAAIDHCAGLDAVSPIGSVVDRERPLALVHARSAAAFEAAQRCVRESITIAEEPPPSRPLIVARIGAAVPASD